MINYGGAPPPPMLPGPKSGGWGEAAVSIGTGLLSFLGNERTNAANAKQAGKQMDFQERMSGTSYQRQVEDLKAAGLNPALAYGAGGASTPMGSSAVMSDSIGRGASSALSTREKIAAIKQVEESGRKMRDERGLLPLQGALIIADQKLRAQQTEAAAASAAEAKSRVRQNEQATKLLEAQVPKAQAEAKFYDALGNWSSVIPGLGAIRKLLTGR